MSDANMDVSSSILNKCEICGDVANGWLYGAISCNPCGTFFRRSIETASIYICSAGTGNCVINSATRDDCQFCRLKMCYAAKMKKKDKVLPADVRRFRSVAANIVVECAYRARKNAKFAALPLSDQTTILAEVWVELFMLTAAYWPFDLITYAKDVQTKNIQLLPRRALVAMTDCRQLELDDFERSMMESIILARKDCSRPLLATSAVDDMLESSLVALEQSLQSKNPQSAVSFGRALLVLPDLRAIPVIYWRDMLGFSEKAIAHLLRDPSRNDPGGNSA